MGIIIHLTENTDNKGVIVVKSGCSGGKKAKKKIIISSDWSIAAVWSPLYLYEIPVPAFF